MKLSKFLSCLFFVLIISCINGCNKMDNVKGLKQEDPIKVSIIELQVHSEKYNRKWVQTWGEIRGAYISNGSFNFRYFDVNNWDNVIQIIGIDADKVKDNYADTPFKDYDANTFMLDTFNSAHCSIIGYYVVGKYLSVFDKIVSIDINPKNMQRVLDGTFDRNKPLTLDESTMQPLAKLNVSDELLDKSKRIPYVDVLTHPEYFHSKELYTSGVLMSIDGKYALFYCEEDAVYNVRINAIWIDNFHLARLKSQYAKSKLIQSVSDLSLFVGRHVTIRGTINCLNRGPENSYSLSIQDVSGIWVDLNEKE